MKKLDSFNSLLATAKHLLCAVSVPLVAAAKKNLGNLAGFRNIWVRKL